VPTAVVESQRRVTVRGAVFTVEETSTVTEGVSARAVPADTSPFGLRLLSTTIQSGDGRASAFDSPVALRSSGSLTVRGRYRLTDCPDVLPTVWPSPTQFPTATQTYSRLEEPLHTAYAICPDDASSAKQLDGLTAEVADGAVVTVRLSWTGSAPLTIQSLGSASAVAVLVTEPACGGACAAQLAPNGRASVTMQPIDPCPPANDDDRLTLVTDDGSVVRVTIEGLHSIVCR